jgi:hypothetical protein
LWQWVTHSPSAVAPNESTFGEADAMAWIHCATEMYIDTVRGAGVQHFSSEHLCFVNNTFVSTTKQVQKTEIW